MPAREQGNKLRLSGFSSGGVGSSQGRVGEGRKRSAGLGTQRLLPSSLVGAEERDRRRGYGGRPGAGLGRWPFRLVVEFVTGRGADCTSS